ncbi:hypothetical protein NHJ13051_006105 [Beauveria bassiana]
MVATVVIHLGTGYFKGIALAELVWAGNMTVNDWNATGVQGEKQQSEKETAQFCFSEGGSAERDEGSDRDKYTKRVDQDS